RELLKPSADGVASVAQIGDGEKLRCGYANNLSKTRVQSGEGFRLRLQRGHQRRDVGLPLLQQVEGLIAYYGIAEIARRYKVGIDDAGSATSAQRSLTSAA